MNKFETLRTRGADAIRGIVYATNTASSPSNRVMNEQFAQHESEYLTLVGRICKWQCDAGHHDYDDDDDGGDGDGDGGDNEDVKVPGDLNNDAARRREKYLAAAQEFFKNGIPPDDPLHFIKTSLCNTVLDILVKLHGKHNTYDGFINIQLHGSDGYKHRVQSRMTSLAYFVRAALDDDRMWSSFHPSSAGSNHNDNDDDDDANHRLHHQRTSQWLTRLSDFREYLRNDVQPMLVQLSDLPPQTEPHVYDFNTIVRSDDTVQSPYRLYPRNDEKDDDDAKTAIFKAVSNRFVCPYNNHIVEYQRAIYSIIDIIYRSLADQKLFHNTIMMENRNNDDGDDGVEMSLRGNGSQVVAYSDVAVVLISALDMNWIPDWRVLSSKQDVAAVDVVAGNGGNAGYDVRKAKARVESFITCAALLPKPKNIIESFDWLLFARGYTPSKIHHDYLSWLWSCFVVYCDPIWMHNQGFPYQLKPYRPPPQKRWLWTKLAGWEASKDNMHTEGLHITHAQRLFANYDSNFTGRLSGREFKVLLSCIGIYEKNRAGLGLWHSFLSNSSDNYRTISLNSFEMWFVRLCHMPGLIRFDRLDMGVQDANMTLGFASSGQDVLFAIVCACLLPIIVLFSEIYFIGNAIHYQTTHRLLSSSFTELVGTVTHRVGGKFHMAIASFRTHLPHRPALAVIGGVFRCLLVIFIVYLGVVTTTIYYIRQQPPAGVMSVSEGLGPLIMYLFFVFQFVYFLSPAFSYEYAWRAVYRRAELQLQFFDMRRYTHKAGGRTYRVYCDEVIRFIERDRSGSLNQWFLRAMVVFTIAVIHACAPQVVRHGWTLTWLKQPKFEVFSDPANPSAESDPSEAAILHFLYGMLYGLCMVMVTDLFNTYLTRLKRFAAVIHRREACKHGFPYYLHFQSSADVQMWSKLRDYVISSSTTAIRRFEGFVGICLGLLFLLSVYFFIAGIIGGLSNSPADVGAAVDAALLCVFLINLLFIGAQINALLLQHIAEVSRVQLALKLYGATDDNDRSIIGHDAKQKQQQQQQEQQRLMDLDISLSRVIRYMEHNSSHDSLRIAYITLTYDVFLRLLTGIATATVSALSETFKVN